MFTFQLLALVASVVFGVWAIKSYNVALEAIDQAALANQQMMLSNQVLLLSACSWASVCS